MEETGITEIPIMEIVSKVLSLVETVFLMISPFHLKAVRFVAKLIIKLTAVITDRIWGIDHHILVHKLVHSLVQGHSLVLYLDLSLVRMACHMLQGLYHQDHRL